MKLAMLGFQLFYNGEGTSRQLNFKSALLKCETFLNYDLFHHFV